MCSLQSSQFRNSNKHSHSLTYTVFSEFIRCIGTYYCKEVCLKIYSKEKCLGYSQMSITEGNFCHKLCWVLHGGVVGGFMSSFLQPRPVWCVVFWTKWLSTEFKLPTWTYPEIYHFYSYGRIYLEITTRSSWEL